MISKIHRNGKDEISTIHVSFDTGDIEENTIFLASFKVVNWEPKCKFYGFQINNQKLGIKHWNLQSLNMDINLNTHYYSKALEEVNNYLTHWKQFSNSPVV